MAGADITDAAEIMVRAKPLRRLLPVHEGEVRVIVALGQHLDMVAIFVVKPAFVGDGKLTGLEVNTDLVGAGEVEQVRFGVLCHAEECLRTRLAELVLHLLRPPVLAGAELAAIAPGCAVAEAGSVDQHHVNAVNGKLIGCLQAGEAAADDDDIGGGRAVKPGIGRALGKGRLIPGHPGGNRALPFHSPQSPSSKSIAIIRAEAGIPVPTG